MTSNPQSQAEALAERKMERMANIRDTNCTYLIQAPSPTVSVPPDLNMSDIAEAALELAGMSPTEARSFCQTVAPVRVEKSPSGRTLVDFGQNVVGRLRIAVEGEEGTTITLRHAEVLENGELGVRPLRTAQATDCYTLRGGGP